MAHRTRRGRPGAEQPALPGLETARQESRAARVAARVAERYSKAPTYSEMLAAEAANAARAAEAAAQAAQEAHSAAQAILDGLDMDPEFFSSAESDRERDRGEADPRESDRRYEAAVAVREPEPPPRIEYHVHPDSLPQARQAPSRESQN